MAHRAIDIRRRLRDFNNVVNALGILAGNEVFAGNPGSARKYCAEHEAAGSLPGISSDWNWALGRDWLSGLVANAEGDAVAAAVPDSRLAQSAVDDGN
jgi:hypothetical protein